MHPQPAKDMCVVLQEPPRVPLLHDRGVLEPLHELSPLHLHALVRALDLRAARLGTAPRVLEHDERHDERVVRRGWSTEPGWELSVRYIAQIRASYSNKYSIWIRERH